MKAPLTATDNITELLVKIIEFAQTRQKILYRNINDYGRAGFVPRDLAVDEFSRSLNTAVEEHVLSGRLILCDTKNVKFGAGGSFSTEPIVDERAKQLLRNSRDEYLELQLNKLMENSLNQRIAAELLRQKQGIVSMFD